MRYIQKDPARVPEAYTALLKAKGYDKESLLQPGATTLTGSEIYDEISTSSDFQKPFKKLKKVLLKEQGYVCAYCGRRIPENSKNPKCVTEHVSPKSLHKELAGEYMNFVMSCQGNATRDPHTPSEEKGDDRLHCDAHKKNEEIKISPLQPTCADHFNYNLKGKVIVDSSDADAVSTRDILNLNEGALRIDRENAIAPYVWKDKSSSTFYSIEELKVFKESLSRLDVNGKYTPFYFVIINVIDKLIGER